MLQFGQVSAYDSQSGLATIVFTRPEACEKCGACTGRVRKGTVSLPAECKPGDWVKVELPEGRMLQAAALAYALPLAALLAGLLLGNALGRGEGITLLCALASLALAVLFLVWNERRIRGKPEWSPRVTEVYAEKPRAEDIGCAGGGAN